jgi:hypothetical protein
VFELVESWLVAAGAMYFIALVNGPVWSLAGELDYGIAFLGAQFAGPGTKGLASHKRVDHPA